MSSEIQHPKTRRLRQALRKKRARQRRAIIIIIILISFLLGLFLGWILFRSKAAQSYSVKNIFSAFQAAPKKETAMNVGAPQDLTLEQSATIIKNREQEDERYMKIYQKLSSLPENLVIDLANNPEMLPFVAGYPGDQTSSGSLSRSELAEKCPRLIQWDQRWGYLPYGDNSTIAVSGCGPTALSMAVIALTRNSVTPADVAAYAMEEGFFQSGTGTSWNLMTKGASHFGLHSSSVSLNEALMKQALDQSGILICSMRKGDFTVSGHFIVIYGYNQKGFLIQDPFCNYRSDQTWTFSQLQHQIKAIWKLS